MATSKESSSKNSKKNAKKNITFDGAAARYASIATLNKIGINTLPTVLNGGYTYIATGTSGSSGSGGLIGAATGAGGGGFTTWGPITTTTAYHPMSQEQSELVDRVQAELTAVHGAGVGQAMADAMQKLLQATTSATVAMEAFTDAMRVMNGETLTPITADPKGWTLKTLAERPYWVHRRRPDVLSYDQDGPKSWHSDTDVRLNHHLIVGW